MAELKINIEDRGMELTELNSSPKFPRRSTPTALPPSLSRSSTPHRQRHTSSSSDTTDGGAKSEGEMTSENESNTPQTNSRKKLAFKGTDLLNIFSHLGAATTGLEGGGGGGGVESGRSSPGPKPPGTPDASRGSPSLLAKATRMFNLPRSSPPKPLVQPAEEKYDVAPKDVSMLERISHKAQKRDMRVRKPHEVFVELEELRSDDSDELEWEETARWIKFEEDVEADSGRWGRPHISALAFHSLVDLRRGLEKGTVLLDAKGEEFPEIAENIVETLVSSGQLPANSREPVLKILLKKHKHTHDSTIWDKLKQSALDPEGRLHHLGDGIRRFSHAHMSSINRQNSTSNGVVMETTDSQVHLRPHEDGLNHHRRISSAPLLAEDNMSSPPSSDDVITRQTHSDQNYTHSLGQDHTTTCNHSNQTNNRQKKVVFNITSSNESLTSGQAGQTGQTGFGNETSGNATASTNLTVLSETSLEIERLPGGEIDDIDSGFDVKDLDDEQDQEHSLTFGHRHRKSVVSLMDKIPEEAESLTILVGGVKFLKEPVTALVRLEQSHLLGDLTQVPIPVRFIFFVLGPDHGQVDYHEVGRAMATLMSDARFHEVAYSALSKDDLLDGIDKFLDDSIVLPPGDWDEKLLLPTMQERNQLRRRKQRKEEEEKAKKMSADDPLKHSRRPFGGMWRDIKKLIRRYPSDFKDALSVQVLVSLIFLYVALLGPAIAFGGLMEEVTNNTIGETETLLATGLSGVFYGSLAVQPLVILAFTGPVLLYESIIYRFSDTFHLEYIEWRACIGLWLMLLLVIMSVGELSFLVHYFTRFSEEIFTGIVSVFFVYEATLSIIHVFERNPLCPLEYPCGSEYINKTNTCQSIYYDNFTINMTNETFLSATEFMMYDDDEDLLENGTMVIEPSIPTGFRICNQPNTAFWSLILCLGTFAIAVTLRKLRHSKFFGKKSRRLVSDFGMLTAIVTMVIVAYLMRNFVAVERLAVLPNYSPSNPLARGWFINPFNGKVSVLAGFGAFIPALLLTSLIFIENQLAVVLINRPENKLRKKFGYHWDLFLVAILSGISGLLGVPFMCAAAIRSIQHLQALSVYTSKNAPGEKPKLLRVHEQRVTNLVVHVFIIFTAFAYKALILIPISVTIGIFYYLAYASIKGVQLATRLKLLFMPSKHHPKVNYVQKVRTWKMHLYTLIQLGTIALLWALKLSVASFLYPLVIVFMVPLKWLLGKFVFTKVEMEALDSEEESPEYHGDDRDGEFGEFKETHVPY